METRNRGRSVKRGAALRQMDFMTFHSVFSPGLLPEPAQNFVDTADDLIRLNRLGKVQVEPGLE